MELVVQMLIPWSESTRENRSEIHAFIEGFQKSKISYASILLTDSIRGFWPSGILGKLSRLEMNLEMMQKLAPPRSLCKPAVLEYAHYT